MYIYVSISVHITPSTRYQEFLQDLLTSRVLSVYRDSPDSSSVRDIVTMFLPACRLLLDFACFPIFCNMDNDYTQQPLLLTDSTANGKIGSCLENTKC